MADVVTGPISHGGDATGSAASHRIVVVGGGAAGLELATRLGDQLGRRGLAEITLVEKSRTHLWKPLLHAVAAGSMDASEHQLNYLAQAHWHCFRYQFGEMIGLDRAGKRVQLAAMSDEEGRQITAARSVGYDTLVIAIGSITNDFGTPGAAEFAVPLETPDQAERFHHRLVNAFLRAQSQDEAVRPGQLHVAIIGAGATGTELAAELYQTAREVAAFGLDHVDPDKDIRIVLVEAADRILPALPERIASATLDILHNLGVEVRTKARVAEVRADGLRLASGEIIPSELVVWAAGVKGPDVLRNLDGLEVNRVNQLVVTATLLTTRDPDIFAIGDCAACPQPGNDQPVPPRAQAAHQEASHLLRQLKRRLEGKPLEPFVYRDFGSLVSFGRLGAIGNLMGLLLGKGLFIEGALARLMYRSLYKMHEMALHGVAKTLIGSLSRGLSRGRGEPRVKLH
ncbi:MAG: NAD(P)/FAD-dependent oxidoreductase [Hyphomicrobiales bacterium]|nr:NAD(P)/FAD-dependent oxidoreductase [Hyphomicrobiales bacterium]MBV9434345.1 NAD(P)/FAD-dependent oxidoreductase [Hyphomicrobiales bacterium]MBV9739450.1 NAD(P)/FAD-dependent oxidoreductase [Hyphomicrobiales bacterium]